MTFVLKSIFLIWVLLPCFLVFFICMKYVFPSPHTQTEIKGWKKIFHANGNQKKAGVTILISVKIDFKIKTLAMDKEGHYIMIKGSIQ